MVARAPRCAIFPGGDGCETFALLLAGGLVLLGHFPGGTHHVGLKNPGVRAKAANHFNHLELRQIFTACRRFCCTRGILLRFQPRHHQLLIRQPGLHAGRHFCAQFNQGPDDFLAAAAKAIDRGDVGSLLSGKLTFAPRMTSSLAISTCPRKQAIASGRPGSPCPSSNSTGAPASSAARTSESRPVRIALIRSLGEVKMGLRLFRNSRAQDEVCSDASLWSSLCWAQS